MVLTRPVTRTKISTVDFGIPVYDRLMQPQNVGSFGGGSIAAAGPFSPNVPTNLTINGYSSPDGAFTVSGGTLVCQVAANYLIALSAIASNFGSTILGTYWGCNARVGSTDVISVIGGPAYYWAAGSGSRVYPITQGQVISCVFNTDHSAVRIDSRSQLSLIAVAP